MSDLDSRAAVDRIAAGMAKRETDRQAERAAEAAAEAARDPREAFAARHMAGVPSAYVSQLGPDPSRWEDEARRLTLQYRHDFGRPMSAMERITLGLSQTTPARAG
jgi:hypothetical protein